MPACGLQVVGAAEPAPFIYKASRRFTVFPCFLKNLLISVFL
jgi:hypothetical protein